MKNEFYIELVILKIKVDMDLSRDDIDNIRAILETVTPPTVMPNIIVICPTTNEACAHNPLDCNKNGCLLKFPG